MREKKSNYQKCLKVKSACPLCGRKINNQNQTKSSKKDQIIVNKIKYNIAKGAKQVLTNEEYNVVVTELKKSNININDIFKTLKTTAWAKYWQATSFSQDDTSHHAVS